MSLPYDTPIQDILPAVREAGDEGERLQRQKDDLRSEKKRDGTIVTEADWKIEKRLKSSIHNAFPSATIVSEEHGSSKLKKEASPTFIIDPIDGTDVYKQGLFGWCISVGLLDESAKPVAGVLHAPRLDLLLTAEPRGPVRSHEDFSILEGFETDDITSQTNIMVSSRVHQQTNLQGFPGKVRSLGSAALHLVSPLVFENVAGAVEKRGQYAWDIAGAHALLTSHGHALTYDSGQNVDYTRLVGGAETPNVLFSGPTRIISSLETFVETTY